MSDERELALELSQHEVEGLHWFEVDRRGFLKTLGGGLLVCAVAKALAGDRARAVGCRHIRQPHHFHDGAATAQHGVGGVARGGGVRMRRGRESGRPA